MPTRICPKGHSYEKTTDCPTCPVCAREEFAKKHEGEFPKIGIAAFGALQSAGITKFTDLTKYSEKEMLSMHGIGPKAVRILKEAMKEKGLSFSEA